ncbi:zinc finger protein 391-like isoform X2 [Limulus polyphemus]|nr:zinc finger protein 391-like isoform X2 [Limulus polyphemus]
MEQEFFCLKSGSEKEKKSHDLTLHENEIGNEDAIQVKEESSSGLIACETILQVSEYEENRDKKGKQQYNLSLQEECLEASVEMEQMESSFKISGNAKELLLDLPQVKSASEEKPWLESESGEECHLVSEFTPQESQYNNAKIKQESSCEVVECDIILQVNENYDCEIIEQENCCLKEDDTRLSMKEVDSELEISDSVSQSSKVHRNWSFPFQALMAHRKRISQNEASKKYHCKECEFSTNVSTNLRRHLLTHTGERPYKCNICEKRFTQKRDLQQHNLFHTGEKPYNCKICGKKFTQGGTLKRHQVIHGGQKPFQCDICGKTFNISQNMKTHKKIHSQGKRYSCDTCGESFTVSSELAVHVKIHGDQRPYHCPHCELRFTWSGNLEKHVMAVHTHNYPYRCSQCNKGCMLLGHLKNHQRTIHGIE